MRGFEEVRGKLSVEVSCKQAEGAKEWGAIRGTGGGASGLDAGSPDKEFLNAANKLQVRLMRHKPKPHVPSSMHHE